MWVDDSRICLEMSHKISIRLNIQDIGLILILREKREKINIIYYRTIYMCGNTNYRNQILNGLAGS